MPRHVYRIPKIQYACYQLRPTYRFTIIPDRKRSVCGLFDLMISLSQISMSRCTLTLVNLAGMLTLRSSASRKHTTKLFEGKRQILKTHQSFRNAHQPFPRPHQHQHPALSPMPWLSQQPSPTRTSALEPSSPATQPPKP